MPRAPFAMPTHAFPEREKKPMPSLSIVIPVYRSEGTLRELHRRLIAALEAEGIEFEVLFVEDCGGDHSWEVIQELV